MNDPVDHPNSCHLTSTHVTSHNCSHIISRGCVLGCGHIAGQVLAIHQNYCGLATDFWLLDCHSGLVWPAGLFWDQITPVFLPAELWHRPAVSGLPGVLSAGADTWWTTCTDTQDTSNPTIKNVPHEFEHLCWSICWVWWTSLAEQMKLHASSCKVLAKLLKTEIEQLPRTCVPGRAKPNFALRRLPTSHHTRVCEHFLLTNSFVSFFEPSSPESTTLLPFHSTFGRTGWPWVCKQLLSPWGAYLFLLIY